MLPKRNGISQRTGNEWVAQPFVFEFFENPTDRYSDKVLLETFDTEVMEKMSVGMECVCGFGHSVREYQGRIYNEVRLYKLDIPERKPLGNSVEYTQREWALPLTDEQKTAMKAAQNFGGKEDEKDYMPF